MCWMRWTMWTTAAGLLAVAMACGPAVAPVQLSEVRRVLPAATGYRLVPLPPAQAGRARVWLIEQASGGAGGYVVDRQAVSRSGPFWVRVVLDPSFRVLQAEVLSYPGERGRAVQQDRFTRQFVGKGPNDSVRMGVDVDAVTGATLSSRAMAQAVREAIRLSSEMVDNR